MGKIFDVMYSGDLLKTINSNRSTFRRNLDIKIGSVTRHLFSNNSKLVPNRIAFLTYQGTYTCNPKAICEQLTKSGAPVELYFLLNRNAYNNPPKGIPENVHLVMKNTKKGYDVIASSKVWVDNAGNFTWHGMPKKDEQVYFQTWHGSLGLKRIDNNSDADWCNKMKVSGKATDYCISNSEFENEVFRTAFWEDTPILEYGHARNDILFDKEIGKTVKEKLNRMYDILPYDRWKQKYIGDVSLDDLRLCLYAPTFKEDDEDCGDDIDTDALLDALEKKYGHKWIILDRRHFKNRKADVDNDSHGRVIDVTEYPDIQELMTAVDVGITDYSSWICDFVLTGKPGFIHAPNLEEYTKNDRGFYYPLEETPFPISTTMEELSKNIAELDASKYESKRQEFLKARGCIEDGHASERIAEKILEVMNIE